MAAMMRKNNWWRAFTACILLNVTIFCASITASDSGFEALQIQPSHKLSSYKFNFTTNLIERAKPIPDFLLEEIKKLDGRDDYRNYDLSASEKRELARYIELLPPRYKKILTNRLIGIYAISPFMGAGLTDWVVDCKGEMYAIMVINPEVMKRTISEWLTYRERSCFLTDTNEIDVSVDAGTSYSALMYFLLHEAAHIVDYVETHTPYVEPPLKAIAKFSIEEKSFVRTIWDEYAKPAHSSDFPIRTDITFYGLSNGPKIPLSKAKELYDAFAKSPFVTLYASQSWAEDFAETAMVYHLTKKLHQPYKVVLKKNGKEFVQYSPLQSEKISRRFRYFDSFY